LGWLSENTAQVVTSQITGYAFRPICFTTSVTSQDLSNPLGDAYVGLASSIRGDIAQEQSQSGFWHRLGDLSTLLISLPLVLYLSLLLGWRVWRPRFWPVLRNLDWIIARLFVTGARYYREADRLLEMHGIPAESVFADEKLAYLYLDLGDAQKAEQLFLRLLAEIEAPLSGYHQASVCVELGEIYLQLHQPEICTKTATHSSSDIGKV
jgi:hypothetical protein